MTAGKRDKAKATGKSPDDLTIDVQDAAERSANLTRQLLAFARKQTITPRVLDLNETVESMLKMLETQGYTVLAASIPAEAIRMAGEHSGEIRLLLTNVIMPEMNGLDLAKNLLSCCHHLKTLFMSGYMADIIAHQGVLDEEVYYIEKPFSMKELAAKVREVLDKKAA
ncbi:MAG TPA: response regulator [Desulfobacteraceae bacterium]|nr:response regulator [Desulfobacteraceae bacterium]HPJ66595.1 response regulator [Desulfobacteraceae bacterium]HPQ27861.1 response regulator [Desulfobacteraceae bacterium]